MTTTSPGFMRPDVGADLLDDADRLMAHALAFDVRGRQL